MIHNTEGWRPQARSSHYRLVTCSDFVAQDRSWRGRGAPSGSGRLFAESTVCGSGDAKVRYLVQGAVRRGGQRVRVTARLIGAVTGFLRWSDCFDGLVEDGFELQERVALTIAGSIEPILQLAEARRYGAPSSPDMTPYCLRLQAHPIFSVGESAFCGRSVYSSARSSSIRTTGPHWRSCELSTDSGRQWLDRRSAAQPA